MVIPLNLDRHELEVQASGSQSSPYGRLPLTLYFRGSCQAGLWGMSLHSWVSGLPDVGLSALWQEEHCLTVSTILHGLELILSPCPSLLDFYSGS